MHIVGHFLNLVVLSFVCFYLVNFRSCDQPIFSHEWFLKAKQYSKVRGKLGSMYYPPKNIPGSISFGLFTWPASWKDPPPKPFSVLLVLICLHMEAFCSSFTGLEMSPQISAKSSAVAYTRNRLWVEHQISLSTSSVILLGSIALRDFMIFCFLTVSSKFQYVFISSDLETENIIGCLTWSKQTRLQALVVGQTGAAGRRGTFSWKANMVD